MTDQSAIDAATKRLAQALDALEAAIDHRRQADRGDQAQLQALGAARSRLASELVEASHRMRRLEEELAALQDARMGSADRAKLTQGAIVAALNSAAERIENVTKKLNQTVGTGVAMG